MGKRTVLITVGALALLTGAAWLWLSPSRTGAGTTSEKQPPAESPPPATAASVPPSPQPVADSQDPPRPDEKPLPSPDEIMRSIETMPLGSAMESACEELGRRMALEDPAKFWAWVNGLNVPSAANRALLAFGRALASKNPEAFWALAKTEPTGRNAGVLAGAFSWSVALSDPARALESADRLAAEGSPLAAEFRKGAIRGAASGDRPELVLEAFLAVPEQQNVDTYEATTLLSAVRRKKDPALAFDTLMKLPEGDYRATVAEEYIREIAQDDPNAAGELVNRMPPGDTRDYAVGRMLNALMERDTDAALTWAEATTDETLRARRIEDLRQHFGRANPAALEALNKKHPPSVAGGE